MTTNEKEKINELRNKGLRMIEIAEKMHLPYNTIKSFCRRDVVKQEDTCLYCGNVLNLEKTKVKKKFCCNNCRLKYWRAKKHV